jgi:hypothetical protein
MKAICPISGVPFRTFDSLPLQWAVNHPVFSIPYHTLVVLLEDIRKQEEDMLVNWNKDTSDLKKEASAAAGVKDLTNAANLAIHEHNWKNPAFRLYQTKHLIMLAFMVQADLLEVETGYAARPKPEIIDSHFWTASELFSWACTLSDEQLKDRTNPQFKKSLPKYRVSRHNEAMENLPEYLEEIDKARTNIGNRFRSASTERKLAAWEMAISILTRRRDVLKQKLSTSHNPLAAKWALTITNAPKQYWDFWYAILSSPSTKITFEGVKLGDKWETVTAGDLRELYDWLDDNLVRPKGDAGEYHRDDTEFYFITRQTVLDIVRTHILILEQGTSSYRIVNAAVGDQIVAASDDALERKAIDLGEEYKRPFFGAYPSKIAFIKAMAAWRMKTKNKLLELSDPAPEGDLNKQEKGQYEIL